MIVKMNKVYIVARADEQDHLLDILSDVEVVHLVPVGPTRANSEETKLIPIEKLQRAIQILTTATADGTSPDISSQKAMDETLDIDRNSFELTNRLAILHQQAEQLGMWEDVRLETFQQLSEDGVSVDFFSVPVNQVDQVQAECVEILTKLPGKRLVVAVIDRAGQAILPEQAHLFTLPQQDRPSLGDEASQVDLLLKQHQKRLGELAHMIPAMQKQLAELQANANFMTAVQGAIADESLIALQGWVPVDKAKNLSEMLSERGIETALQVMSPAPDEKPPTLISYPAWAKPIKGLFDILGTMPGYREFDVGLPFLIALPVFAAMLIGDGGYGALLFLGLWFTWPKSSKLLGKDFAHLLVIIGVVALAWGLLCGSFFGVVIYTPLIPVNMYDYSRFLIMKISFFMGAIHLSLAQLWQALRWFPDVRFLNKVGWALFIWGILGVVQMFVLSSAMNWHTPWPYLLCIGATMTIVFKQPSRNVLKMIGLGLADFPLSMLSSFSDVISYVRLMAVGLASGILASSFNDLALGDGFWLMSIPILIMGHALNFSLALIALFSHGVRLNMLEFSSNLGMQWTGYPYKTFTKKI